LSTVREAFEALLSRCDGAAAKDGEGFNGRDAQTAHSLGQWDGKWTPKQEKLAYKMLKKYQVQLTGLGFDYDILVKENDPTKKAKIWIADSKYGPKIAVKSDYNPEMNVKFKEMDDFLTHRRWTPDLGAWTFDANSYSVGKLLELGFEIPLEVAKSVDKIDIEKTWAASADDDEEYQVLEVSHVSIDEKDRATTTFLPKKIVIELGGSTARIKGFLGKKVINDLNDRLSFRPEGVEWTYAVQNGEWDGYVRLFKKAGKIFPIGLLTMVQEVLDENKVRYDIIDDRKFGEKIDLEWSGWDLRPYQREALDKALLRGGGTIAMPTGSGKTLVALKLIQELGRSAVVFVHRKELLYQWDKCFREYLNIEPGLVGDGLYEEKDFTIAMLQTVTKKPLTNEYDTVISDEDHHIPAETFQEVVERCNAKWRYGLSATPKREDGREMMIWAQVGTIVAEVTVKDLVDQGYLARPRFVTLKYEGKPVGKTFSEEYRELVKMETRNDAIIKIVEEKAKEGYKIYVDVKRIKHGKKIAEELNKRGTKAIFISGASSTKVRQETLKTFEEDGFVLVSTLIKEGVDLPAMSMIVLAGGGKSGTVVIQTIGRALRPKPIINEALIVDLMDKGYYTRKHFNERSAVKEEYYGDLYMPEEVEV